MAYSYEKEQERLLELWKDVQSDDDECIGSASENEEDELAESDHCTDTEQEVSDEEDVEQATTGAKFYKTKDETNGAH